MAHRQKLSSPDSPLRAEKFGVSHVAKTALNQVYAESADPIVCTRFQRRNENRHVPRIRELRGRARTDSGSSCKNRQPWHITKTSRIARPIHETALNVSAHRRPSINLLALNWGTRMWLKASERQIRQEISKPRSCSYRETGVRHMLIMET